MKQYFLIRWLTVPLVLGCWVWSSPTAFAQRGEGGGQGGGFRGMGGGDPRSAGGRVTTPRVVIVADESSNSLIVSAPEEQMTTVSNLLTQIDSPVDDVSELRVFKLKFADAQETADVITSLFPDPTSQGGRNRVQFGNRGGGMRGFGATSATGQSERALKQSRVLAVPDLRTASVIVSAAPSLMEQIGRMIDELDADPARKQKVFVYSLENTDPQAVQEALQSLFPSQNYGSSGMYGNNRNSSRQTGSQLNNRATQMQNRGGTGSGTRNSSRTGGIGTGGTFGQ